MWLDSKAVNCPQKWGNFKEADVGPHMVNAGQRKWPLGKFLLQSLALHVLHRDKVFAFRFSHLMDVAYIFGFYPARAGLLKAGPGQTLVPTSFP